MKRFKIGIVGLNFGRMVLEKLVLPPANRYFQVEGVCDLDRSKTLTESGRWGIKAYGELDEMLADPDVQVVGLFTGPTGRAGLIRRIIRAGKDVVTTKPFEYDAGAALGALQEARENQRLVLLNSPAPELSRDLHQIAKWRDKLNLGRPVGARAEVWANYREKSDGSWFDDPKKCPVAPIFRLGIYLINDLVHIMGDARRVQVASSRIFTGRPTPDNAQLGIEFENGALANIYASFAIDDHQHYRNSLTVNFERGTIYRNIGPLAFHPGLENWAELSAIASNGHMRPKIRRRKIEWNGHGYPWGAFHKMLRMRSLTDATLDWKIVEGLAIIEAAGRAEKTGQTENVIHLCR